MKCGWMLHKTVRENEIKRSLIYADLNWNGTLKVGINEGRMLAEPRRAFD